VRGQSGAQTLVTDFGGNVTLLSVQTVNGKPLYLFSAWLGQADGGVPANPQMQDWPYFQYFIYHVAARAAGATTVSFATTHSRRCPTKRRGLALLPWCS